MPIPTLGIIEPDGLALEGLIDSVVSDPIVYLIDITKVGDDGGVLITATGEFPLATGIAVHVKDGTIDVIAYSGKIGKGSFPESSPDGATLQFVAPKLPEALDYDLEFIKSGSGSGFTLANALDVIHRTYSTPLYSMRADFADPRDAGASNVEDEPTGSSEVPDDLLHALVSAISDTILDLAGFLVTRSTVPFVSGGSTLTVESTDRWGDPNKPSWEFEEPGLQGVEYAGSISKTGKDDDKSNDITSGQAVSVEPAAAVTGTVTVYGINSGTGIADSETFVFSASSTPQTGSTTWSAVMGATFTAVPAANILIRDDGDNDLLYTITTSLDQSGCLFFRAAPMLGGASKIILSANAATVAQLGIYGRDVAGVTKTELVTLNGTNKVPTLINWGEIDVLTIGLVEVARTITYLGNFASNGNPGTLRIQSDNAGDTTQKITIYSVFNDSNGTLQIETLNGTTPVTPLNVVRRVLGAQLDEFTLGKITVNHVVAVEGDSFNIKAFSFDGSQTKLAAVRLFEKAAGGQPATGVASVVLNASQESVRRVLVFGIDGILQSDKEDLFQLNGITPVVGILPWSTVQGIALGSIPPGKVVAVSGDVFRTEGKFAAPGGVGTYTGLTDTTLTGVVALFDIASEIMEITREFTAMDQLRESFFIPTADSAELNIIGRNSGCPRPLGVSTETYRSLLPLLIYGQHQTIYTLERVLDVIHGAGKTEIWVDPANLGVVNIKVPTVDEFSTSGKSYLFGDESVVLASDLDTTLIVKFEPKLVYGVYSLDDANRARTNYALKRHTAAGVSGARVEVTTGPFNTTFTDRAVIATDPTGKEMPFRIESVISASLVDLSTFERDDGLVQDSAPTEFIVKFSVFNADMVGDEISIRGSTLGNDGTFVIATVVSAVKVTLTGATFVTELDLRWVHRPVYTAGEVILLDVLQATFVIATRTVTVPNQLRKGFFAFDFEDAGNELGTHVGVFTGDPVNDGGAIVGGASDYGNQPDMDSAYTSARTYMVRYHADVDGGTDAKNIIHGTADGSGDDGLEMIVDWSEGSNALKVRVRDVAGATIFTQDYAFKPTVGVTYWFMLVLDFGGSGDGTMRVFTDGSSTVTFSSSAIAISGTQSWTSSHNIGAGPAGANPGTDTRIRSIRFYKEAVSDANGGKVSDGSGYTTNLEWHLLPVDFLTVPQTKNLSTFNRGTYLMDYTTTREDTQLMPDLVPRGEASPFYLFDHGALTKELSDKILAAGVITKIVTE